MAKKIRKQTLSLKSYLDKMKDEEIRSDQDVQRFSGQWDKSMINELIVTVLTDDYIPPIILGEEERGDGTTQLWIIDGLQRSSTLALFRYGNHKITTAIEDGNITYQKNKIDNGKVCRDENGNIIKDTLIFNIIGKTYEELPNELKKKFDDYQLENAVHQNCSMQMISKLIRRYNNHKSMNTTQKAFTYIDKFARKIREITELRFFKDCGSYTDKEREKGDYERIVMESVMIMNHMDKWKKAAKDMGIYLNKEATDEEFDNLKELMFRLENIVGEQFKEIFNTKNSFIWFSTFNDFTKLELEDSKFAEFLTEFQDNLHSKQFNEYENKSFDTITENSGTKDKKVIIAKLDMLKKLMVEFFEGSESVKVENVSVEQFISEHVGFDLEDVKEDIEFYNQTLDDLLDCKIAKDSKLREPRNRLPLLAMVVYSYKEDVDLDDWIEQYSRNIKEININFKTDKENYLHMKEKFDRYNRCLEQAKAV
jgi:hypothetical protein